MDRRLLRAFALGLLTLLAIGTFPMPALAQRLNVLDSASGAVRRVGEPRRVPPAFAQIVSDTTIRPSRRGLTAGAVVGGLVVGLATTAWILNATAPDCTTATSASTCSRSNHIVLHTVTISAGTAAGAMFGARIGSWVSKRR
jgi:hypothetical protein